MIHKYTTEQAKFIVDNVLGISRKELTDIFNQQFLLDLGVSQITAFAKNHKLKNGIKPGKQLGESSVYPPQIKKFIEDNVKGMIAEELTTLINKTFETSFTVNQIRAFKKNNKLSSGLSLRFAKGQISWNKGKKKYWIGGEETQFKKGYTPHNYLPVGTERINSDGYVDIKIADPNKWKAKQILVWEKHNGPVPEGGCIIFGDKNRRNFDINNLILVTNSQLLTLNHKKLIQNDADLTRTGVIIADLYLKMGKRKERRS